MQDTAKTLGELDPAARARVLHWLQERFLVDAKSVQAPPAVAAPAVPSPLSLVPPPLAADDEQLTVGALEDFFAPVGDPPPAPAAPQTVTGMLTEFVAEFQNIAREWDDACAAPAEQAKPVRRLSAAS